MKQFLVFSERLLHLDIYKALGIEVVLNKKYTKTSAQEFCGIIGWGRKYGYTEATYHLKKLGLPYHALEEGFIAYDHNSNTALKGGRFPFSYSFDEVGVYYDATSPSKIEQLLVNTSDLSAEQNQRVENFVNQIKRHTISKYNPQYWSDFKLDEDRERVLVVDQIKNDKSISYGNASASSFKHMLEAAFDENPGAEIILKTHPMVLTKPFSSYLYFKKFRYKNLKVCSTACNPHELIKACHTVYTVTSQMGFEAILNGVKTRVFGMPFYAGWGLTSDDLQNARRTNNLTINQLAYEVFFNYLQYFNPFNQQTCKAEDAINLIISRKLHQPI